MQSAAMRILDTGKEFHIHIPFGRLFNHNLRAVKELPGRRWINGEQKYWLVPGSARNEVLELVESHHATLVQSANILPEMIGEVPPIAELDVTLPWREGIVPRPYQLQGIAQAMKLEKCLNGDEQGLGKTMQSIGTMLGLEVKNQNPFPCLIVCPSSMKGTWKREWEKFSHKRAMVLDSKMTGQQKKNWFSYVAHGMVDVVIVNYESLNTFCVESYPTGKSANGRRKPWKAIDVQLKSFMSVFKSGVLDESHRCKDATTNQAKFILRIFNGLRYRLLLSGTPVVNKPIDLFPQLAILGQLHHFGNKSGFVERYCDGGTGANNLKELNYKLNLHCFFRREKKDVAKDLPDKQRETILCDITNREEYDRCKNDFEKYLRDNGCTDKEIARKLRGEIMVQMMKLKMIAGRGKMNEVKEFVNEVLEGGNKLILFCHLHEIVDECLREWPDAVTVTGRDDNAKRNRNIESFQNDPNCKLIICNHKAAGVGITLTASSRVAFIEYPWTYADCVQCEDRAHRIGQKNSVMCTYFLGQDTIDERMWEIISTKMTIGNTITGATDDMDSMEMIDKTLQMFTV